MRAAPSRGEVESLLVELISEVASIPRESIGPAASLDNELRMESVAFVEIQVAVEETYEIELDLIRIVELNEFGAIVDYIHETADAASKR